MIICVPAPKPRVMIASRAGPQTPSFTFLKNEGSAVPVHGKMVYGAWGEGV